MSKITLKNILADKKREIRNRKSAESTAVFKKRIAGAQSPRKFAEQIRGKSLMAIAEIKKKSPSAAFITAMPATKIAHEYEKSRFCCAVSVLTDRTYFGGDIKNLQKVKSVTTKPVLRKDFIIDEYQIYESRAYGADIILLIASILSKSSLKKLFDLAKKLGMECLIESHTPEDIKKIPKKAELYGINTRDLKGNFATDLSSAEKLLKHIPAGKVIIVESGLKTKKDIDFVRSLKRINAVLIGTSLLKTPHPGKTLDRLLA